MAFRLRCVSELYRELGKFDAVVEFTELAVREFIQEAENGGNFDQFITERSKKHKIRVDAVDQSIYRSRISQSYILSVYQRAELFIHEFRIECNDLKDTSWKLDDTKDSILIKTIRKISAYNPAVLKIGEHNLALFDYYRVIRNKYSHDRIEDTKVEKAFAKISNYKKEIMENYPGLNAPNDFNNISFDDFILFTRVIKDIAYHLSNIIAPSDEEVKLYYLRKNFYSELNQNPARKANALKAHMRSNFGIETLEAEKILALMCH